MAVARLKSVSMVNFDHVSISAATTGPHDNAGRRGANRRSPWSAEIDAGMKGETPRERIDPAAEAARQLELRAVYRSGERNMMERREQCFELSSVTRCTHERRRERVVLYAFDAHGLDGNVGAANSTLRLGFERVGIHAHMSQHGLQLADTAFNRLVHSDQQRCLR